MLAYIYIPYMDPMGNPLVKGFPMFHPRLRSCESSFPAALDVEKLQKSLQRIHLIGIIIGINNG